jgi:hypothetical protein
MNLQPMEIGGEISTPNSLVQQSIRSAVVQSQCGIQINLMNNLCKLFKLCNVFALCFFQKSQDFCLL